MDRAPKNTSGSEAEFVNQAAAVCDQPELRSRVIPTT